MYCRPSLPRILVLWICLSLVAYSAIINGETVRTVPNINVGSASPTAPIESPLTFLPIRSAQTPRGLSSAQIYKGTA